MLPPIASSRFDLSIVAKIKFQRTVTYISAATVSAFFLTSSNEW
jgi:hypothetical protein